MLGSEATYRHRLHAPCPTVVAQRDARHTVQGVGNIGNAHGLHALSVHQVQGRRRSDRVLLARLGDGDTFQLVNLARDGISLCHST